MVEAPGADRSEGSGSGRGGAVRGLLTRVNPYPLHMPTVPGSTRSDLCPHPLPWLVRAFDPGRPTTVRNRSVPRNDCGLFGPGHKSDSLSPGGSDTSRNSWSLGRPECAEDREGVTDFVTLLQLCNFVTCNFVT